MRSVDTGPPYLGAGAQQGNGVLASCVLPELVRRRWKVTLGRISVWNTSQYDHTAAFAQESPSISNTWARSRERLPPRPAVGAGGQLGQAAGHCQTSA